MRAALLAVLAVAMSCGGKSSTSDTTPSTPEAKREAYAAGGGPANIDWQDWQNWTKANALPFPSDGHKKAFVDVMLKPDYATAYTDTTGPKTPGLGILKVEYKSDKSTISGFTVMAKMAPGYDPDNGDWYYAVLGSKMEIKREGKLTACIGCHSRADSDYVFGVPK